MENGLSIAKSPIMWIFAIVTVGLAMLQAYLIYKKSVEFIGETDVLSKSEVKTALKTGGIVAIGPALSVFVIGLTMVSMLGAPITLMRVGIIGSASTELTTASVGTQLAGVTLGQDPLTAHALATALWALPMQSIGFLIFVPLFTRGLGKPITKVLSRGEDGKVPLPGYLIGYVFPFVLFAFISWGTMTESIAHFASFVVSAVVFVGCYIMSAKMQKEWIKHWAMGFGILSAMIVGGTISQFIG